MLDIPMTRIDQKDIGVLDEAVAMSTVHEDYMLAPDQKIQGGPWCVSVQRKSDGAMIGQVSSLLWIDVLDQARAMVAADLARHNVGEQEALSSAEDARFWRDLRDAACG